MGGKEGKGRRGLAPPPDKKNPAKPNLVHDAEWWMQPVDEY